MLFQNRAEAGRMLAEKLADFANRADVLTLALPRGGVPVGFEVAIRLRVPLDVFLVRKLGVPGEEELAMGAIATGGVRVLNERIICALGISDDMIDGVTRNERQELQRRERLYRDDRPFPDLRERTAILVDDGLATGATMYAAAVALRKLNPAHTVVAVPVAVAETCDQLRAEVDEVICAITPEPFDGVGRWYKDFSQTTDDEVRHLLMQANQGASAAQSGARK
ncbi:MAG: phosphoribosyltransferase [Anaerolineae bacterium]|nr:phosphoribosyltransferase [Anaerolineae bacterium]